MQFLNLDFITTFIKYPPLSFLSLPFQIHARPKKNREREKEKTYDLDMLSFRPGIIEGLTFLKNFLTEWFLNFSPVSFVDSFVHMLQSALLLLENLKRSKVKHIRKRVQKNRRKKIQKE